MALLNYAQLYTQALEQKFAEGLYFSELWATPNNSKIRWMGANVFKVPSISVTGMTDVDRDTIGAFGRNVDNQYQTMTLDHYREFSTLVDPQDIDETNMAVSISNITSVFNEEQKLPEMDKYMASSLYTEVSTLGTIDTTVPAVANILTIFDNMCESFQEAGVPLQGAILHVIPAIDKLLKNAEQISRSIETTTSNGSIDRAIKSLEEVRIKVVPSERMKSAYDFTVGAVPAVGAKQINMMLVHPRAIYAPLKYEFVSVDEPSATTKGKFVYYESNYSGVFAIEKKIDGIQINAEA